jgi:hypothetical protein
MNKCVFFCAFLSSSLLAVDVSPRVPVLPDGARAEWHVADPEELVLYLAFDPATVQRRLPSHLRFITIAELASGGVPWAKEFLGQHPTKGPWGVSFLEFIRAGTFTIDGRAPVWPAHGAVVLWFARVAPSDPTADLGPGRPLLALDFWLPDSAYVGYMRRKGYYASYGAGRLSRSAQGQWSGSLAVDGLTISAECTPIGPVTGGPGSASMQTIFPPASSSVTDLVRIGLAGHREQACVTGPTWTFRGSHPLAGAVALESPTFQFGYQLRGGTYPHP